jgi:hypothetical protein
MKKARKLKLAKETIRNLGDKALGAVNGGGNTVDSCVYLSCACPSDRCLSNEVACLSYGRDCTATDLTLP